MLFLNPALLYSFVWITVLGAYELGLSELLIPLNFWTKFLLVGSSITFILGWVMESTLSAYRLAYPRFNLEIFSATINSRVVERRLDVAWIVFVLGVSFEIIYFGGAPGFGLVGLGPAIIYTDFGISGLHGLINSIFYACCSIQFLRIAISPSKRAVFSLVAASLMYPFLGMSRQVLVSLLIQYFFIYITINKLNFKGLCKISLFILFAALIFGWSGDIRSGRDHIIELAAPSFAYPDWLPSALIWIYIYFTSPLGNLNYNIDISQNIFPFETVGALFPSFLRESVRSMVDASSNWNLVSESFNVSSLLQAFLIDFGIAGTLFMTFIFGVLFSRVLRRSENSLSAYFFLVVILHGIALSFFANLLIHLVFIFQVVAVYLIFRRAS